MTLINSLRSLNNPHWSASIINIDEESVNTKDHPLAALMLRDDRYFIYFNRLFIGIINRLEFA